MHAKTEKKQNILEIKNLQVSFRLDRRDIPAVKDTTFSLKRGRMIALVGESGCGKTVTAFSILNLIQKPGRITGGKITLKPKNAPPIEITKLNEKSPQLYSVRSGLIGMIFQEPMTALSPVHTVGNQISEALRLHKKITKIQAKESTVKTLQAVGFKNAEDVFKMYPHEISGGMRQRAVIAMALVCKPELLIADEPTTALDVTIQAQILALIKDLQKRLGLSVVLITHDFGVVAQTAEDVAVMYLGRIVESGLTRDVIKNPRHPYTKALLKSLPSLSTGREKLFTIKGSVPSLTNVPNGCPFHPRCQFAQKGRCDKGNPPELKETKPGHNAACLRVDEI